MALGIECPKCGSVSISFVRGVCRACYMRDFHQKRTASAATECPRCSTVSANFVRGVCRACYMRDYHQRRSASALADGEGRRLCVECGDADAYARGLCRPCYVRDYRQKRSATAEQSATDKQSMFETQTFINDSEGRRLCTECGEQGVYALSLCLNCYMRDRRRRHRMKVHSCETCGVSFQSARSDALYCSMACRQRAHRVRNASSTSSTGATVASSSAYPTASSAAKVSATAMRGLYRPRRLLSVYRPVAASQVVPATRRRS
jgi:NMD protein affecting ribosome stability and mRNA decay